jgi:hypothetical protein
MLNAKSLDICYLCVVDVILEWITKVAALSSPPLVMTIGYVMSERFVSHAYAAEFNKQVRCFVSISSPICFPKI